MRNLNKSINKTDKHLGCKRLTRDGRNCYIIYIDNCSLRCRFKFLLQTLILLGKFLDFFYLIIKI